MYFPMVGPKKENVTNNNSSCFSREADVNLHCSAAETADLSGRRLFWVSLHQYGHFAAVIEWGVESPAVNVVGGWGWQLLARRGDGWQLVTKQWGVYRQMKNIALSICLPQSQKIVQNSCGFCKPYSAVCRFSSKWKLSQDYLYVSFWQSISCSPPPHLTADMSPEEEFLSTQCCCHMVLWRTSSHLIIIISNGDNISLLHDPLRKSKLTIC